MKTLAFTVYLVVLIWSPLAFGAFHAGGYTFMILGVLAACLLLVADGIARDRKSGTSSVFRCLPPA